LLTVSYVDNMNLGQSFGSRRMPGASYPGAREKRMKKTIYAVIAVALAAITGVAISHGGGLDKNGCHNDHKNGDYHCHR
jgi:hypothetical protein